MPPRTLASGPRNAEHPLGAGARSELVGRLEFALTVIIATFYSCDLLRMLFNSPDGQGSPAFRFVTLGLYGLTLILLLPYARDAMRRTMQMPLLFLLIVMPLVSVAWSISPSDTLSRATTLVGSSMFGVYIAVRFSTREIVQLLSVVALVLGLISLGLIFAVPHLGVTHLGPWAGTWRGAWGHKNNLGAATALHASILVLYILNQSNRRAAWPLLALGVDLLMLAASRSLTAQLTFIVCVGAIFGLRSVSGALRVVMLPTFVILAPLIIVSALFLDGETIIAIVTGLGKDATFSGRLPMWETVVANIQMRPWLGFGYEAFWVQGNDAVRVIENTLHFRPFYAHNGVLELMLSLGIFGVIMFAGVFATFLWQLGTLISREPQSILASLTLVFLITFALRNISEASLLARNDLAWCLFIALHIKLCDAMRTRRRVVSGRHGPPVGATALQARRRAAH